MTLKEVQRLARALGQLQGQTNIDEFTRQLCVDAVEEAIQAGSNVFQVPSNLREFREAAKVKT